MGTVIVILVILVVVLLAVKSTIKRILHGSSCCGERDALPKKIKPADKNKSHYPYEYILSIDGMHCSNCSRRIENTLNSIDGLWAKVNLEKKSLIVLSKKDLEASFFETEIGRAGYTVLSVVKNFIQG
ncbi:MAG: heavy-metal-associated domain-containing protein [Treponema sp.]|nr:heavy-metal-associated domain-containing protein [Treponema sp.]